jgi:hypothetical protein
MKYPFVREDSFWKDPAKPEGIQVDESVPTPRGSCSPDPNSLLKPSDYGSLHLCLDSDENEEGCFQMGNLRVRKGSLSQKPQPTEEAVPTNDLKQDVLAEQGAS